MTTDEIEIIFSRIEVLIANGTGHMTCDDLTKVCECIGHLLPAAVIKGDEDCPRCGEPMNAHYNYCPCCGQALDWIDYE